MYIYAEMLEKMSFGMLKSKEAAYKCTLVIFQNLIHGANTSFSIHCLHETLFMSSTQFEIEYSVNILGTQPAICSVVDTTAAIFFLFILRHASY
jgi:hypothetical protein